jgi:hypothetical protein
MEGHGPRYGSSLPMQKDICKRHRNVIIFCDGLCTLRLDRHSAVPASSLFEFISGEGSDDRFADDARERCYSVGRNVGRHRDGYPRGFHVAAGACASQSGRRRPAISVRAVLSPRSASGGRPAGRDSGLVPRHRRHLFPAGVAVVVLEGPSFIALPIVGSLLVVGATALFAVIVFRTSQA